MISLKDRCHSHESLAKTILGTSPVNYFIDLELNDYNIIQSSSKNKHMSSIRGMLGAIPYAYAVTYQTISSKGVSSTASTERYLEHCLIGGCKVPSRKVIDFYMKRLIKGISCHEELGNRSSIMTIPI